MKRKYRILHKIHKNSSHEFISELYHVQSRILFLWCDELNYIGSLFNTRRQAEAFIRANDGICCYVKKIIEVW